MNNVDLDLVNNEFLLFKIIFANRNLYDIKIVSLYIKAKFKWNDNYICTLKKSKKYIFTKNTQKTVLKNL